MSSGGENPLLAMIERRIESWVSKNLSAIFEEYDEDDLRRMIVVDYDLVENEMPDDVARKVERWGGMHPELVRQHLTAERIISELKNPPVSVGEEEEDRLKNLAEVIQTTPGGMKWLREQVRELWRLAGAVDGGQD